MKYYNNVLETIGNTPLVKINKLAADIPALVLAKIETTNPGNSVKDRIGLKMVNDAEKAGLLKPGGTIIECTSGNTGMGLALVAIQRGYRCIFTTNDKQSRQKIDLLRAVGAEVIVCPTNVGPEDPRSYYSVAEKLSKEIPNSFWFNQYDNLSNRQAHYESTGPEIWEQTAGKITHFVVGVGTGGTISGIGRYLKEKNPDIKIWGIDTYGSVFKKYHETGEFDENEIYPYITEGIGEDIIPQNVDFDIIDRFEKVTDKDAAIYTRELARKEGMLVGNSAGSAMGGLIQLKDELKPEDVVVVLFHDHASRYIEKMFNDDWMRERGFLDDELTVKDLIALKDNKEFISIEATGSVGNALKTMKSLDISQLPVMDNGNMVGSLTEQAILNHIIDRPLDNDETKVADIMSDPFPMVEMTLPYKQLNKYINRNCSAVVTKDKTGAMFVVTQYDLIHAL